VITGDALSASGATIESASGNELKVDVASSVDVTNATLDSGSKVSIQGESINADTSSITSPDGSEVALEAITSLSVSRATVDSGSSLTLKAERVDAPNSDLTSATGSEVLVQSSSGTTNLNGASVDSGSTVTLTGDGVTATDSSITSPTGSSVSITAEQNDVDLDGSTLESGSDLTLTSKKNLDIRDATLESPGYADKKAVLSTGSGTLFVEGAQVVDQSNRGDELVFSGKNTKQIDGCLTKGSIPGYDCSGSPGKGRGK
jgi:hypothetical protein